MTAYELAKKYYPLLWDERRIEALFRAGKITEEEYKEIIENTDE